MDFADLYTSPSGRISRKLWWLGVIGLIVITVILSLVIGGVGGAMGLANSAFGVGLLSLVSTLIIIWPAYVLGLKRLHDRSRPEILALLFIAPSVVTPVFQMLGVAGGMEPIQMFGVETVTYKPNAFGHALTVSRWQ